MENGRWKMARRPQGMRGAVPPPSSILDLPSSVRLASSPLTRHDDRMFFRTASLLADAPPGAGGQLTEQQMWVFIGLGVMLMIYMAVIRPMMRRKDPLDRPTGMASLSQQ